MKTVSPVTNTVKTFASNTEEKLAAVGGGDGELVKQIGSYHRSSEDYYV